MGPKENRARRGSAGGAPPGDRARGGGGGGEGCARGAPWGEIRWRPPRRGGGGGPPPAAGGARRGGSPHPRHTTAIPPCPTCSSSRYRPSSTEPPREP